MFERKQQKSDAVDVNDFIVGDNMQHGIHINGDLGSPVPSVDISADQIIDADYSTDPKTGKRFKASQIAILAAVAVFAAGGIASIFIPTGQPEPSPVAVAVAPATETVSSAEVKLPPGLADLDSQNNVPTPSPTTAEAPSVPDVAATTPSMPAVLPSPALQVQPLAAPATTQVTPEPPVSPTPVASTPTVQQAVVPPTAATSPNPISSQIAEAQKLQTATPTPSAAKPATTSPVPSAATPAPSVTPKPVSTLAAPKKESAPPVAQKPSTTTPPKPKAVPKTERTNQEEHEGGEETIKRLITTSADAFGLQSIQEGAITLESRRGSGSQRLHVGDRLPSGEQILRIDARSMTLVTDRSVIRIN